MNIIASLIAHLQTTVAIQPADRPLHLPTLFGQYEEECVFFEGRLSSLANHTLCRCAASRVSFWVIPDLHGSPPPEPFLPYRYPPQNPTGHIYPGQGGEGHHREHHPPGPPIQADDAEEMTQRRVKGEKL